MSADQPCPCPLLLLPGWLHPQGHGILAIQLLFTACSSAFFMFHEPTRFFVLANHGMLMTASIAPFPFLLGLYCYKDRHPLNMALLAGFTAAMTYTVGVVCAAYYQNHMGVVVLQALILTATVFISLTSYVMVTKKDFSYLGSAFSGLIILNVGDSSTLSTLDSAGGWSFRSWARSSLSVTSCTPRSSCTCLAPMTTLLPPLRSTSTLSTFSSTCLNSTHAAGGNGD